MSMFSGVCLLLPKIHGFWRTCKPVPAARSPCWGGCSFVLGTFSVCSAWIVAAIQHGSQFASMLLLVWCLPLSRRWLDSSQGKGSSLLPWAEEFSWVSDLMGRTAFPSSPKCCVQSTFWPRKALCCWTDARAEGKNLPGKTLCVGGGLFIKCFSLYSVL